MSAPHSDVDPLILTAAFDPVAGRLFQLLRDRHFPAGRNIVPAHLTLFHKLPGAELAAVEADLRQLCGPCRAMPFAASDLRFLGRGVALAIEADELSALRAALAERWRPWLSLQDAQSFRAHVTIQNKVDPAKARALRDQLARTFTAVEGSIVGLNLWHYRGGPWEKAGSYAFPP